MHRNVYLGLVVIVVVTLACRPVLAISWNEFLIISVLFMVLLGPPLYRLVRRVEFLLKNKEKDK